MKILLSAVFCLASLIGFAQSEPEKKLKEMNIVLNVMSKPIANYVKYVKTGNLVFLSGHGPINDKGQNVTGKLGKDLTIEEGYAAARLVCLDLLATLKDATGGDLGKVKRVIKILGLVNCTAEFADQPKVMNGCSDLLVAVFGEKGKHARSAVGTNSLPGNIAVEIEMVVELE